MLIFNLVILAKKLFMSDSEKIDRVIANNDEAAFRSLVEKYQHIVFKTCFMFVHNKADADDLAQDVFIEMFQSLYKYRKASSLSTWLYRIAVNKSLNFLKKQKRRNIFNSIDDWLNVNISDTENSILENTTIEEDEKRTALYDAINALPDRQKRAFTLSNLDELSYKEIAEIMKTSLSSVESLIHRARKSLQKKLIK